MKVRPFDSKILYKAKKYWRKRRLVDENPTPKGKTKPAVKPTPWRTGFSKIIHNWRIPP